MKNFLILALVSLYGANAIAAPLKPYYQDIKLPTQAMLEHQTWTLPIVATANYIATTQNVTNASGTTTVTSFAHQPDYPRNITITTGGTTASIAAGTAVVTGTNFFDQTITENFTISADQNGATTGNKAFKTVTSVVFPAGDGASATFTVGVGSKLGMKRCSDEAGYYVFSVFNSAYETTRGTMAVSSTAIESNTFAPNGTMDGAKPVELFFVQNYRCFP
jgi:hypothetical protein